MKILFYDTFDTACFSSPIYRLIGDLGLHHSTITKCIKNGLLYLIYFMLRNELITNATKANISLQ